MTSVALPQLDSRINVYSGDIEADVAAIRTIKAAEAVAGKLSAPSKMPGFAYSLPASKCRTGSKLASIPGTVCHGCYAADDWEWLNRPGRKSRFSRYAFNNVKSAMARRYDSLGDALWVPAMVVMIRKKAAKSGYFRWHDSGDIQSPEHLRNIALVCEATPDIQHWIPTREYKDIDSYRERFGEFPANLTVRVSAHRVGKLAPSRFPLSSIVLPGEIPHEGIHKAVDCPAYKQGGECGDCRACWNSNVPTIAYPEH
tara:strand:+ start:141 stop:908 length:768 start_codon:yes stop_codon:yes gene_type:complete